MFQPFMQKWAKKIRRKDEPTSLVMPKLDG